MKKVFSALTIMLCMSLSVKAIDVNLEKGEPEPNPFPDVRSVTETVEASIEDQVLTVSFGELTASQIVVINSTNQTVFDQTYMPAYSVQANLSNLSSGSYTLYIYVFGSWWYGNFVFE